MSQSVLSPVAVEYPSSDGKPMAENDAQRSAMFYLIGALRVYFTHRRDVYVSGDLLVYYEEGNPRASVAPDVLVAFGVEDRERQTYKVWEEGKAPNPAPSGRRPRDGQPRHGSRRSKRSLVGSAEDFLWT